MGIQSGVIIDLTALTTTPLTTIEAPITSLSRFGSLKVLITATQLKVDDLDLPNRKQISIQNNGVNALYVGNSNLVSKDNGIFVAPAATLTLGFNPNIETPVWGISLGKSDIVFLMEV